MARYRILQLLHWGPIIALSVIAIITTVGFRCALMWWPTYTKGSWINLTVYFTWLFLILYNYFLAAFKGPGFVPIGWKPKNESDCEYLQFCEICDGYKSPRAHHCRKCNRCVMKMDHHCPWINTCCGHFNHANFTWFLFFAPLGCIHATCILVPSVYRAINWHYYMYYTREPVVHLDFVGFLSVMFAIGLAIGVTIAVGLLFCIQMKNIIKNETGIESWIIEKAQDRIREEEEGDFVYPYHMGWRKNMAEVFTWSGRPKSDGFTWNVAPGCNQYTLTIEQIEQKALKRERTIEYHIVEKYNGATFPISKGCKVCTKIPCTDEPRIVVAVGDRVLVTRWKK
ncbi:hypothetical protein FSP39_010126 [Pinctada imbricata]|uniref:Palmitoyltransferase n=1 Tax=Pinctada imbricata TaxID=66713 RepID=A0AA88Y051_PINIB|nr:hypothetical protein FSP39_010126 [Pinctada imbricata]